jgi:hypothetical protein
MRIDSCRLDIAVGLNLALQAPHAIARRAGSADQTHDASIHTPALELADWVAQVRQLDDVRPDVISEVARRLADGEYSTPNAAERAAEALLDG